ncbi:hypothetical protein D9615_009674 [Tricholomella constricta]|uniref:WD40 repeat-like protein n=1 Tax=Tricholomella constricta TaxID=117010 RepID=A0A8H5GUQ6_9AGAR|nr:hypothetical protein D9615_009674 [Tricholomella constricta]
MNHPQLSIQASLNPSGLYADSRSYGYQGPTRNVRLYRATPTGGGAISQSEDGVRCAVTGKESLRIIHISDGSRPNPGHKSSVGRGGQRIDASRNLWDGSGLKIDCASTDVAWGHGVFNNKILTSARNGELIMWDLNKTGPSKYERRSKDHLRSINALSVSHIVHHYCITGSADGDLRVWDLRDMSRSLMRIHHPTSVRSVVFSPSTWNPLHAVVGLDNGSIYRWDLKNGQRGLLDRLPVAHTASVTTLDWCCRSFSNPASQTAISSVDAVGNGLGWLVSGGLDRCVKVWDLTGPGANTRMPSKPSYTLHPSFPVRRVVWRPAYECELAVVSNVEFSSGSNPDLAQNNAIGAGGAGVSNEGDRHGADSRTAIAGDAVEIWDVRRGWIPKWSVTGSAGESGVTDLVFGDPDVMWTQNSSGTFSQIDLRHCTKPVDAVTSTAATWEASGSLTFVADVESEWQIPYDDMPPDRRLLAEKQQIKMKALGDERFAPISQDVGTFQSGTPSDLEAFNRLARGYVFHGGDRPTLCAVNARVAFQTRRDHLAQTWLLLGASLTEVMPATRPAPPSCTKAPSIHHSHPMPHSPSAPAVTPSSYTFPASVSNPSELRKSSPSRASVIAPRSASASTSRKITPASSNTSSPRQIPIALPSVTPRRPSIFSSRENGESDFSRRSSISVYRRPSISAQGSLSPADRSGSLRHVGEGALDDSDSSSASGSDGGDEATNGGYSDDEISLQPLTSPGLLPSRGIPTPSPLSRVAGQQQWTEDESRERYHDDGGDQSSSPSPRSTDSGSERPITSAPKRKSSKLKRHPSRMKSRSRSSTVASLAAPAPPTRSLVRHESHSSIRTVTAGEVSFNAHEGEAGVKPEEAMRDVRAKHDRRKSMPVSELALDLPFVADEKTELEVDPAQMTDRRIEMVTADEKRFRETAWTALREALERFADEGDIQMCAMLSVLAADELKISKRRAGRFLESYIDLLTRRRLHACSAYLRKYCQVEDIRTTTLLVVDAESLSWWQPARPFQDRRSKEDMRFVWHAKHLLSSARYAASPYELYCSNARYVPMVATKRVIEPTTHNVPWSICPVRLRLRKSKQAPSEGELRQIVRKRISAAPSPI